MNIFARLKNGLAKARKSLGGRVDKILSLTDREEMLEELEEILITSDMGMDATMKLTNNLRHKMLASELQDQEAVKTDLKAQIIELLGDDHADFFAQERKGLRVVMMVGVNGVGKTTTIAKLAYQWQERGQKVMLAASDTFRAAAAEQLVEWGNRLSIEVIRQAHGADPAAVAYDAVMAAKSRGVDVLIVDTAGRLHNKKNLMAELSKICRVVGRDLPDAPHDVLLVIDGNTGQNGIAQASTFNEATNVTGVVVTKLDGTAKGGVCVAIRQELGLPIRFVGVGEAMEDLLVFNAEEFVEALIE